MKKATRERHEVWTEGDDDGAARCWRWWLRGEKILRSGCEARTLAIRYSRNLHWETCSFASWQEQ